MAEIEDVLSRLQKVFSATKLKYVIVGGIAVIHYGHIRTTQDIDLIVEDNASKLSQFASLLKSYEFDVMMDQFQIAYKEKTNISIFDKKSFLRLDITIAEKKREYDVLESARRETIFGKKLYIAPLEYVLLGKLLFMGRIDEIPKHELLEYQDIIDFLTLYHANEENIDKKFLKRKARELKLEETLERLLEFKFK
jgi:hypothetical protein